MNLPPPIKLGLPPKFSSWRKGQSSSVLWLIDCAKRFPTLNAPVGSGKSLTYAAYLRLTGGRAVILTSTKSLQDQLAADFSSLGFVDVRGQSNYPCPIEPGETVDLGPCHAGYACDLKRGGCPYYDAQRIAYSSEVTITNYSWWLYHNKVGEPYPAIDTLILDEAHAAPDELADFLSCTISKAQIRTFLSNYEPPITKGWRLWAKDQAVKLEGEIEGSWKPRARSNKSARRELRSARMLLLRLQSLSQATSESDWVVERAKPYKGDHYFRFDPTWPGPYSEQLFRKTPKVILVSATLRPKTLQLLNIKEDDYEFRETPSTFLISRRPVIHFVGKPRVALTYRSPDSVLRMWITRIDNIIRRRLDRKGIIHSVSYVRRDFLLRNSRYADHFIIHDSGQQQEAVARFKAAKAPAIFLSPSATTGLDFPYCLAPTTKILKADLTWEDLGNLQLGDKIAGFDEEPTVSRARSWKVAKVTSLRMIRQRCYKITTEDGTQIIASEGHKWLVRGKGSMRWVETRTLRADRTLSSKIVKLFKPWVPARTYDAGYLSGAFDGEGSLYWGEKAPVLSFAQNDGAMQEKVKQLLTDHGFHFGVHNKGDRRQNSCRSVVICGRAEIARFLGTFQPVRLLPKWDWSSMGTVASMKVGVSAVVSKEYIGVRDVVAIGTTTKTLVAEGFASHNSEAEYSIIAKVPFPDLRSKILQARARKDRDYSMYLTALDIVQASGRGMRAEDDRHETWIVDDQFGWFFSKYKKFFPQWFIESVKRAEKVLDPLPKL